MKPPKKLKAVRAFALVRGNKIRHWLLGGLCVLEIDDIKENVLRDRFSCEVVEVEIREVRRGK